MFEWKDLLVREEQRFEASSVPVIWQGSAGQPRFKRISAESI